MAGGSNGSHRAAHGDAGPVEQPVPADVRFEALCGLKSDVVPSPKRVTTGLMRCNNGAATSLHFPVAVMSERNANRLAPATTETRSRHGYPGQLLVMKISAAPL